MEKIINKIEEEIREEFYKNEETINKERQTLKISK